MQVYLSHEKGRGRQRGLEQQLPYTSRRGEDSIGRSVEKKEAATMVRRKSISGNLRKKVR